MIFRIGHLGDTVVALPALWALRDAFPTAHIALLSNSDTKNLHYISPDSVLPPEGLIDEFIAYPTNLGAAATVAASLKLAAQLRSKKFDAVVYLMPRARTLQQIERDTQFFRLAGIDRIFGVNYLKETRLDEPIPIPTPEIASEADHLVQCMLFDGLVRGESEHKADLLLTSDEIAAAEHWLRSATAGISNDAKLIAIAPGSKWESKVWSEERFTEVVARMIDEFKILPMVFGGSEDHEKGNKLIASWRKGVNSSGALSVRESAALLKRCALYLGNDTGTMHLAAAVGTPCVAVFAAIDWVGKWTPFGDNNRVFRKRVECEGCHTPTCFNNHKCLDLVTVDEVYTACAEILNK